MEGIQSGQVSVLRQAGANPAWEEHHHSGLRVVGFQADAAQADVVEERCEQVKDVLQEGGVPGDDVPAIRVSTIRLKMVGERDLPWVTPRSDLNTRLWYIARRLAH